MKNLDTIAEDLFKKLRGRFDRVTMGNDEGKVTSDPSASRFYDFDFEHENQKMGSVSIALFDSKLSVIYNEKMVKQADSILTQAWYDFLREMRMFAKRRVLGFDARNINKSNLNKRDYKFLSNDTYISESTLSGNRKKSYQRIGNAKLNIKHSKPIDTETKHARTNNIDSIFIESNNGERFKYPYIHLNGARAMTRHVSEGGTPYDEFGKHIIGLSEELTKLNKFKRYINRSKIMAEGLSEYKHIVENRVSDIKKKLYSIQTESGYKTISDDYENIIIENVPEDVEMDWIDQLTIKQFNEELKDIFPYVYRLVAEHKEETLESDDFLDLL